MELLNKIVEFNARISKIAVVFVLVVGGYLLLSDAPAIFQREVAAPVTEVAGAQISYVAPTVMMLPTATPTPVPIAAPVRIEIPAIGVDTQIENVGITPENVMDIPHDFTKVGWYDRGAKPGESGAAILNGHFDRNDGSPAVFYKLELLEAGDEIFVTTQGNNRLTFKVKELQSYPLQNFPIEYVYGQYQGKALRLITCDGIWDQIGRSYTKRLIVLSDYSDN